MRKTKAAIAAVAMAILAAGCSNGGDNDKENTTHTLTPPITSTETQKPLPKATFSKPVTANMKAVNITIPSIKLNEPIKHLGLNQKGELSPPKGIVQWYNKTPTPGANGISVVAGHVTYNEPDVFWNLHKVKKGETITIKYNDGSDRKFKVVRAESIDKKALQKDPTVWGESSTPSLVVATCDADSRLVGEHRLNNFVLWAVPVN